MLRGFCGRAGAMRWAVGSFAAGPSGWRCVGTAARCGFARRRSFSCRFYFLVTAHIKNKFKNGRKLKGFETPYEGARVAF